MLDSTIDIMETAKFKRATIQNYLRNSRQQVHTNFLCSTPTLLSGAATVLNISGNFYKFNTSQSAQEADEMAIENDWLIVGHDLCDAIDTVSEQYSLNP
jgi:hypothetical protein